MRVAVQPHNLVAITIATKFNTLSAIANKVTIALGGSTIFLKGIDTGSQGLHKSVFDHLIVLKCVYDYNILVFINFQIIIQMQILNRPGD